VHYWRTGEVPHHDAGHVEGLDGQKIELGKPV